MNNPKSYELQALINIVYEAVDKSSCGPMFERNDDGKVRLNSEGFPFYKNLAFQTFLSLIGSLTPRNISGNFDVDMPKNKIEGDK